MGRRATPASPTPARRRPTPAPRAARRSAALGLLALALLPASAGATGRARFSGEVTDALRNPTHRLATSGADHRAAADLLFTDAERDGTKVRTCVRRRDGARVRTCFTVTTGAAGTATVTPLRFPRGSYVVGWRVDGAVVARWRFVVVAG
ncbi:MAG: hypothetical protein JSS99_00760 [Actinobacteria bacterium]|nr:hypothetical protein [Actinomycetota bacterium]